MLKAVESIISDAIGQTSNGTNMPETREINPQKPAPTELEEAPILPDGSTRALRIVRLVHTVIWALFAACIALIPVFACLDRYSVAYIFIAIVFVEVLILIVNGWSCPLTSIAVRYTHERRDNFDIYLPEWIASNNKLIFGTLYVAGILLTVARSASSQR